MSRTERLKAIKEIIRNNKVSSQEELMDRLEKRGFPVTQPTISRDMNYLRIAKVRNYKQDEYYTVESKYSESALFGMEKLKSKFKDCVISISRANNIIVIKTYPGEAQGVAALIDGMNFVEILGTVAGDDTIISIMDDENNAKKIMNLMQNL